MPDNCVFCRIAAGTAPATIVREWEDAIVIVPLGPVVDGHVLVIPRRHVPDFTSSPTVTATVMGRAAEYAEHLARPANLITSKGREATQSVFHLHVHVVPRSADDGLMVPWGTVYGDDPQAPHWCRVAEQQAKRIDELEATE
ncbi:HIT family protein [Nocardia sp. NPDC058640]|uniref:HIT family protein n=1 Tax=Nocardia sp. NPDC058640 TaxID=3346571 RepID=UPI0036683880